MAQSQTKSHVPWLLGWDLGAPDQWTESGPGRLLVSLLLVDCSVGAVLGHHAIRSRWPWIASTGLSIGATFVLGMLLWGYWLLIRRMRSALVSALARGEKGPFRSATKLQKWLLIVVASGTGISIAGSGFPMALLILAYFPWAVVNGIESLNAYKEVTRLGFGLRDEAIRSKLSPHFIFNAMNTLTAQIEKDPQAAQATTEHLAQLFRQVITASDQPTIPLKEELAFVEAYLGIERARLGERLRVTVDVPEALEAAQVPPLSLQVLVENAVKHGVAPLEQGGEVRIGAEQKDGALHLWVEDPGPGVSALQGTGTALATLRQRLEKPEDLDMGLVAGQHRVGFRWRQA